MRQLIRQLSRVLHRVVDAVAVAQLEEVFDQTELRGERTFRRDRV